MNAISAGASFIDVKFQGLSNIIATVVLVGPSGVTLIDPGPSSTLRTLRQEMATAGIGIDDVASVLLTHIHLDHAGATGTLLKENPRLRVYVHANGAPHMVDPSRLIASAARLYGSDMDRLWGEFLPVPESAIVRLEGGERLEASGRTLDVAYTPGHASHHVSFFCADIGVAFVGDTAGVRLVPGGFVLPPTPPPDIDYGLWDESLSTIEGWRPDGLFMTHFGLHGSAPAVLAELRDHLGLVKDLAAQSLAREGDDASREVWFCEQMIAVLRKTQSAEEVRAYETAGRPDLNWRGLARYLRKR